ncbi:MAG: amidohydrolase family protein, partial [Planctomycetaceae bacterium]
SVGRFLGELVRDRQLMSLEAAVRKLTGWPAERFGLTDRGTLEVGKAADIVVFDPQTMSGAADYQDPTRWTSGISTLLVNGREVLDTAGPVGNLGSNAGGLPGRVLRSCRSM